MLSAREYFAGQALNAMLRSSYDRNYNEYTFKNIIARTRKYADDLVNELHKTSHTLMKDSFTEGKCSKGGIGLSPTTIRPLPPKEQCDIHSSTNSTIDSITLLDRLYSFGSNEGDLLKFGREAYREIAAWKLKQTSPDLNNL